MKGGGWRGRAGGGVDEGDGWKDSRTSLLGVLDSCAPLVVLAYSTTPRNENPVNENHLEICLSFSQKNRN